MTRLQPIRIALLALAALPFGCHRVALHTLDVDEIAPAELAARLRGKRPPLVLDLRDTESYRRGHIPGALSVQIDQIAGLLHHSPFARDRELATVCYHGNTSIAGAATAQALARGRVLSISGGMARWSELGMPTEKGDGPRLDLELLRPPLARLSLAAQVALVASRYGLAPLNMFLSLVIVLALRRFRGADLSLLRRGVLVFLIGEGIGLANHLFFGESDQLDLVHGLGIVAWGALASRGLFRLLDERVLRLAAPESRCLAQPLRQVLLALAPSLAILALLPLAAPVHPVNLRLEVFGATLHFWRGVPAQVIELRLYPLIGAALLLLATLALLRRDRPLEKAQQPFFSGLGFLCYSLIRAALSALFHRMPAWSSFWEEATKLMAVVMIGLLLHLGRAPLGETAEAGRRSDP